MSKSLFIASHYTSLRSFFLFLLVILCREFLLVSVLLDYDHVVLLFEPVGYRAAVVFPFFSVKPSTYSGVEEFFHAMVPGVLVMFVYSLVVGFELGLAAFYVTLVDLFLLILG